MPTSRPTVHFTARNGWINDPHGLTFHDGAYHLFFQHVPGSPTWQPGCHWGHAVSPDLVSWTQRPDVLTPGDEDDGVWSGCVSVDPSGHAQAYYTSVRLPDFSLGRIRRAHPTDRSWDTWVKDDVVAYPPDSAVRIFRDPFILQDAGTWRMLVGTSLQAQPSDPSHPALPATSPDSPTTTGTWAAITSLSSPDRARWTLDGVAASRPSDLTTPLWTGSLWECPQLFEINGRWVLLASVWEADQLYYPAYAVGTWDGTRFEPEHWHRLTYGGAYYAPSLFRDRDGRPCLILWLRGAGASDGTWVGAHSVPVLLSLEDDELRLTVHPEAAHALGTLAGDTPSLTVRTWPRQVPHLTLTDSQRRVTLQRDGSDVVVTDSQPDAGYAGGSARMPGAGQRDALVITDGPVAEVLLGSTAYALTSTIADIHVVTDHSAGIAPTAAD